MSLPSLELDVVCFEAGNPIAVFGVNIGMNRIFALFWEIILASAVSGIVHELAVIDIPVGSVSASQRSWSGTDRPSSEGN